MTKEEFNNSWVFKTGRKLLMKKFPWVTDVIASRDPDQYDSVIFVDLKIDVIKFLEDTGFELENWARNGMIRGHLTEATAICVFTTLECSDERGKEIEREIEAQLNKGRTVKAVPSEIKGDTKKKILASTFILDYPIHPTEP